MTREELLTAARQAKEWRREASHWPWLTEDELRDLPEPDALYVSLASPDVILEMQAEIDELRAELR